MEEKKPMTIEELAAIVQAGFSVADQKTRQLETHMDRQFEELKERTFDSEEKEGIVAVIDAYNQQLEDSALGTKDITLTRPEYDATAVVADFPNRFTTPAEAFAD